MSLQYFLIHFGGTQTAICEESFISLKVKRITNFIKQFLLEYTCNDTHEITPKNITFFLFKPEYVKDSGYFIWARILCLSKNICS